MPVFEEKLMENDSLLKAIAAMRAGGMVIMVDDEDRENEGDLVMAAEFMTPEKMNFMVTHGRGLVCLPMEPDRIAHLGLPPMVQNNSAPRETAFTISIEAREGVTTGISAADRARTILAAVAPNAQANDLVSPGHIFPLRAVPGGVLERNGHTEGSIALARLSGLQPSAVICEILNDDGTMARMDDLVTYGRKHDLPIISIAAIVSWCKTNGLDPVVGNFDTTATPVVTETIAKAALPSIYGSDDMTVHAFRDANGTEHVALVKGNPSEDGAIPLVRLHSECVTGDALGSMRCDCGQQLQTALRAISKAKTGVLVYVRGHEGRGIGLGNKIRAYALQDQGADTVDANLELGFEADSRDWHAAHDILRLLGITKLAILTNNPEKINALRKAGFDVVRRDSIEIAPNRFNQAYLHTKQTRMGHTLHTQSSSGAAA